MSPESHPPVELFWQAFRYASDEMTSAEREAFEAVLAADQPAREAVARVIELEGLVRAAEALPIQRQPSEVLPAEVLRAEVYGRRLSVLPLGRNDWLQPIGWVALGAAACLAAVMAFQAWWPAAGALSPDVPHLAVGSHPKNGSDAAESALALAWARAQAALPAPDDSPAVASDSVVVDSRAAGGSIEGTAEPDPVSVGDDQVAAAPAWLLAAVADAEAAQGEN